MGSSSDSEKIIQRLNDELREVQELANAEKHKCMELQGKKINKRNLGLFDIFDTVPISSLFKMNLIVHPVDSAKGYNNKMNTNDLCSLFFYFFIMMQLL